MLYEFPPGLKDLIFHKFEYVKPEVENLRHKKNLWSKDIFPPKMASENAFKKCGVHL